jgi:serine/threonine-protein kinase
MKCPKCHFDNPETATFCADCGTQLIQQKDIPAVTKTVETPFPQFNPGTSLVNRYEIIRELGKGGMGEVYLAEDTNLKRQVAIKVLPQLFALDKERLARFEREARLLASLNHPNIATIHGLEKSDGQQFLVMELVEGDTLADRIKKGPLPVNEALEVCRQIAEGLESAHEKGIIHRDLKPANLKVTPDGKVKILDFGIAKAFQDQPDDFDPSKSPAITDEMTRPGVILGTAAYMSPEQAKGKAVDKRSDIWAFGCLLFECLTGKKAFKGETISETMASILKDEPDLGFLPKETDFMIQRLIKRCLKKDQTERLRDIGDARIELEESVAEPAVGFTGKVKRHRAIPFALTAIVVALLTAFLIIILIPNGELPASAVTRALFSLPDGQNLVAPQGLVELPGRYPPIALSQDGKKFAYVSRSENDVSHLYIWKFDQWEPRLLFETAKIELPFFSPDGTHLGFLVKGEVFKISVNGGLPLRISEVPFSARGAAWGADGTIILGGSNKGLLKIEAEGGEPSEITRPNSDRGEQYHAWPEILPDGKHILFTAVTGVSSDIGVMSLETGQWRILERTEGASQPHYLESGHLVFFRNSGLFALPFDLSDLEPIGSVTPVLDNVFKGWNAGHDLGFFSVSRQGTLVYVAGGLNSGENQLVLVDRQGVEEKLPLERSRFGNAPAFSPDGKLMALAKAVRASGDLWILNLEQGTLKVLTSQNANIYPVWSTDSKQIFFSCFKTGSNSFDLFRMSVDESEREAEPILVREFGQFPTSLSPDGRFLAYEEVHPESGYDIHILPLEGDRKSFAFINTSANEHRASFSPDGRFLAYISDETGRDEVYVKPVAGTGGKELISKEGGHWPRWSLMGNELFYLQDSTMMAVDVELNPNFHVTGKPKPLFEGQYLDLYDVTADGQHFVMITKEQAVLTHLNVILNWFEELKRKVSTGK